MVRVCSEVVVQYASLPIKLPRPRLSPAFCSRRSPNCCSNDDRQIPDHSTARRKSCNGPRRRPRLPDVPWGGRADASKELKSEAPAEARSESPALCQSIEQAPRFNTACTSTADGAPPCGKRAKG